MGGRTENERGYGYWFPLVLLGFGLLGKLAWDVVRPDLPDIANAPGARNSVAVLTVGADYGPSPFDVGASIRDWLLPLVAVVLVGTMAWYGVRARAVRRHLAVAVGGVVMVLACQVVAGIADAVPEKGELVRSVGLPLVVLGLLTGAYYRFESRRRVVGVVSVVCLALGVSALLGAEAPGLFAPVVVMCGLLVLARYEGSRVVVVLAVVVPVALLAFPYGFLGTVVPAMIVLAGAVVALVRRSGQPAPA
jgi:hypothetical protein